MEIAQTILAIGEGLLVALGGINLILKATYKYTDTEKDDKLYKFLRNVEKVLEKVLPTRNTEVKVELKNKK